MQARNAYTLSTVPAFEACVWPKISVPGTCYSRIYGSYVGIHRICSEHENSRANRCSLAKVRCRERLYVCMYMCVYIICLLLNVLGCCVCKSAMFCMYDAAEDVYLCTHA